MTWQTNAPHYQPHASQFAFGLKGACTLLALACCDVVSKGIHAWVGDPHQPNPNPASTENVQAVMYRIYKEARQRTDPATGGPCCAPNGAATQSGMLAMAGYIGLPVADVLHYADVQPTAAWVDFLRRNVAHATRPRPVLMQVSNGRAAKDANTGAVDEPDLQSHAIAVLGTMIDPSDPTKGGYIVCDGDNPSIANGPVIYSLQTLAAMHPTSMIAFNYKEGT